MGRLTTRVVFPVGRPCRDAWLVSGVEKELQPLPVHTLADGRTVVQLELQRAQAHQPYTVRWSW